MLKLRGKNKQALDNHKIKTPENKGFQGFKVVPPVLKPIAQYIDNQLLKLLNILNLEQKMFHLEQVLFQPLLNLTEVNLYFFQSFFIVF